MHFIIFLLLLPLKIVSATADGYCGVYHGEVCKNYVDNTKSVWYNTSGGYENEVITAGLWEELIVTLDEPCRSAAEKLLCIYAFPECNVSKPLPLCYEDCVAVNKLFCYKEWAEVEDKKSGGCSSSPGATSDCQTVPSCQSTQIRLHYAHTPR
ncbi:unnamed protein product [Callosobruchus maculatus]|uniref:FZ domain-containing protein n=1 Tax=Callosobruchus maculatus TaxID=64391 RepID=A0A653DK34_CALMS|nr:unnamed protein product [Callosobruchus maculatus]